jgi:hypothetical protein
LIFKFIIGSLEIEHLQAVLYLIGVPVYQFLVSVSIIEPNRERLFLFDIWMELNTICAVELIMRGLIMIKQTYIYSAIPDLDTDILDLR